MDIHQKMIQNEEATPFFSDSEDDTSPPKKRAKHVSDFDSSEQLRVFDLDLNLPELKPGRIDQWHAMFFVDYNSESAEVFKDTVTKCREEITALQEASDKANSFFVREFAQGLAMRKGCPYTSMVLETIVSGKSVNDYIDTARKMLNSLEVYVETYLESVDGISLETQKAYGLFEEKLEQLCKIINVDKMIKYWECEDTSNEEIERLSGLTVVDIWCLTPILQGENKISIEENQDREKFDRNGMTALWNEKAVVEFIGKLHPFREAYSEALSEDLERRRKHEENLYQVCVLATSLECAGECLRVMRQQLKLLYDKDVIAKGYDELFPHYWRVAGRYEGDEFGD